MYGLNIHIKSFFLNRTIARSGDKIRVSITTVPDEIKDSFVIECDESNNVHHFFTVNISSQTKKIIFVFRRKSFINNDPIIASTIVHINELPQSATDNNNTEMKTINIYEPIQNTHNSNFNMQNRAVYGQMQIQFTPSGAFPSSSFKHGNRKNTNRVEMVTITNPNKSYGSYGYVTNENQNDQQKYSKYNDQDLFVDPDPEQLKTLHQYDNQFQPQDQYQQQPQNQYQEQPPQNQYQEQPQNQYQQQQDQYQYQQQQNQYQYQQQQNQYQYQQQQNNQYQPQQQNQFQPQQQQPKGMVFVDDLI